MRTFVLVTFIMLAVGMACDNSGAQSSVPPRLAQEGNGDAEAKFRPAGQAMADTATIEERLARLERIHPTPIPSQFTQIGLTRTWIPKFMDRDVIESTVSQVARNVGLRDARASNLIKSTASIAGLEYEMWSGDIVIGGQCNLMQKFVLELEAQNLLPTFNVDGFEGSSPGRFDLPRGGTVQFHVLARESDSPQETEAEYRAVIGSRKAITDSICIFVSEEELQARRARAELAPIVSAVKEMMAENGLSTLLNPVAGVVVEDEYCAGEGTSDMAAFPDTSTIASGDKALDPAGNAYVDDIDPLGDKDGYVLAFHDAAGLNSQDTKELRTYEYTSKGTSFQRVSGREVVPRTSPVEKVVYLLTEFCYTAESDGTVRQYDRLGNLLNP